MRPRGDRGEVTLILEVKGYETEQDRAKGAAAHRWVAAVNNWGELGTWRFAVCREPGEVEGMVMGTADEVGG